MRKRYGLLGRGEDPVAVVETDGSGEKSGGNVERDFGVLESGRRGGGNGGG